MDLLVERDNRKVEFGDMIFVNGVCPTTPSHTEAVAQKVFILLRTFENEWFLNSTTGIPYVQQILGKKSSKSIIDRTIQEKILAEEGVAAIEQFSSSLQGRVYEARVRIKTTQGGAFDEVITV